MNRVSFFLLLSLFASAQAFMLVPSARTAPYTQVKLMSQEDTDSIVSKVSSCVDGECSLDEVEDLIELLQSQQKEMYGRVEQIRSMVKSLETVNSQDDREVDQIRETVRAIYRVFQLGDKASGNDYPSLSKPTGWSGEIGDGPTTAYDALPPKPYKKSP